MTLANLSRREAARQLDTALDADLERSFKMAQALVKPLDAIMASARPMPAIHRHTCECGDYFCCAERDCSRDYTCPSCLYQQQDDFFRGGRL